MDTNTELNEENELRKRKLANERMRKYRARKREESNLQNVNIEEGR